MTEWQQNIPGHDWDKSLFAAGGHLTQSSHWAAAQSALGKKVYFAEGNGWQCLAIFETGKLGTRLYCPYGPTVKSTAAFDACLAALKQLAKKLGAVYIRVEPVGRITTANLKSKGFRHSPQEMQPKYTWVKDLTQKPEKLLSEMTSTNRNLYNTAAKKGLVLEESRSIGDLHIFLDMIHEVAKLTGMKPHTDSEFQAIAAALMPRNAAKLYFALHNRKPVASAFVYDTPTTRYYAHAAGYNASRNLHAGSPLMTKMILDAKAKGQKQFDFFGASPPNEPKHRWAGFTKFKQSFGGHSKEYLGTWELPIKPLHYAAYRLAHKLNSMMP